MADARGFEAVVGMAEAEAAAFLDRLGYRVRVVERDGESPPITMEVREDRANLTLRGGRVTAVAVG